MKEYNNGDLYDVYYKDADGNQKSVRYFGYTTQDAKRLFNSERDSGDEIIDIKKVR